MHDGVATVVEVDDAIRYGAGLRWAIMGTFLTYRLAGGEDGMRAFVEHFGPALAMPWTKLVDVPELTPGTGVLCAQGLEDRDQAVVAVALGDRAAVGLRVGLVGDLLEEGQACSPRCWASTTSACTRSTC